ncbi:MAG: NUDIX domain-containing protein [Acidimicrobiia bacterium]|nr:NUDIX domain-containing protein [Acidimicrobiia bacterium]
MRRTLHLLLLRVFRRLPRRARLGAVHTLAPSFTVGAMCLVERVDGHVLLVLHSYRQRWGLPGGLLQRGEEVELAARREVSEEVDLDVELVGEPAVVVDPDARRVDVIYRARLAPGASPDSAAPCSPEVVEVGWFDPGALPELQHETSGALVALARTSARPAARPAS